MSRLRLSPKWSRHKRNTSQHGRPLRDCRLHPAMDQDVRLQPEPAPGMQRLILVETELTIQSMRHRTVKLHTRTITSSVTRSGSSIPLISTILSICTWHPGLCLWEIPSNAASGLEPWGLPVNPPEYTWTLLYQRTVLFISSLQR